MKNEVEPNENLETLMNQKERVADKGNLRTDLLSSKMTAADIETILQDALTSESAGETIVSVEEA